jgi:hypothetical protein
MLLVAVCGETAPCRKHRLRFGNAPAAATKKSAIPSDQGKATSSLFQALDDLDKLNRES